jgi:hypothetical protein
MDIMVDIMGKRTDEAQYLLRMTPETKKELSEMADAAGVTLSEAFRQGARMYLEDRLSPLAAASAQQVGGDELVEELRSVASRVERRLRGS